MNRSRRKSLWPLALVFLAACGGEATDDLQYQALVEVEVSSLSGDGFCIGIALDRGNTFLLPAHCVSEPSSALVAESPTGGTAPLNVVAVHPNFRPTAGLPHADLAVVRPADDGLIVDRSPQPLDALSFVTPNEVSEVDPSACPLGTDLDAFLCARIPGVSAGQSGAPLVDDGAVIGILTALILDDDGGSIAVFTKLDVYQNWLDDHLDTTP